jgi:hypothetical protein
MQLLGHRRDRLLPGIFRGGRAPWCVLGALIALVPALWMWGFTVDDALISVRYARHLAAGIGWRFDAGGPSTDGVTPLPYPLILAPLAGADALVVLARAKALGLLAWTSAGAAIGGAVSEAPLGGRLAALATLALSVPVGAYAVSGMETALAMSLASWAAVCVARPRTAALLAGLAASLRPEMAPWALTLAVGAAIAQRRSPAACAATGGLALAPFVLCAVIRAVAWGRPAPLALMAKPSDLDHGLLYAGAACVVTLTPVLVVAPRALARTPRALVVTLAAVAHVAAVVVVGGDWMPLARLMAPVAPSLAYAGALASERARPIATAVRAALAVGLGVVLLARGGSDARHVGADRAALVAEARPWLAGARRVAALDIGWLSAATEADIVDLAGLTDPEIAALPGGHTSKRVDARFLLERDPDALLLYLPYGLPDGLASWPKAQPGRVVEARLMNDDAIPRHFTPAAWLPLRAGGAGYILLRTVP